VSSQACAYEYAGGRCEVYSSVGRGSDEDGQLNIREQEGLQMVVFGHACGGGIGVGSS
jgi:hypothetical protein